MSKVTNKDWTDETNRRWGLVVKYFKSKENQVILDFIRTAGELEE